MSWAHYLLQVNIYLIVFYGFYKLLLDKETYFTLNRIYLVSSGLLSLFIPFLRFEWFTRQAIIAPAYTGAVEINYFVERAVVAESPGFSPGNLVVIIYAVGVLFFLVKLVYQLASVSILLKKNSGKMAFSFFSRKIVDERLPEAPTINRHEEVHIRQFHTADVIFFEVLGIITWFNPIIYLYKHTVKSIHEYLADEEAARFQGDKETYSLLLLSSAFGVVPNTLTNRFFNKSLIKKRIFMLHKQRSRKTAILKYGMALPLFAIMLVMSSATIRNNEKIQNIAKDIPLEQPLEVIDQAIHHSINPEKSRITLTASVNQEWENFYSFIKRKLHYPLEAVQAGLQGNSQVKFTLRNGEVRDLSVVSKTIGYGCDAEVMRNILNYTDFKKIADGKYVLTIEFRLDGIDAPVLNQKPAVLNGYTALANVRIVAYGKKDNWKEVPAEELVKDFGSLDVQPSFPGGIGKFSDYLQKNLRYPEEAAKNKIEGKVLLSFVVETDGSITDINVEQKLGFGTDEEAVKLLKGSPKWTPGVKNGQNVRVKFNIPINFKLSSPKNGTDNFIQLDRIGAPLTNPPLYILDGERIDDTKFKTVDPASIESVHVLKGEAAIKTYGEDGKNGAIQIITKKGKVKTAEKEKP